MKVIDPCVLPDFQSILENHKSLKLKCGENDDGFSLKIKVKTFLKYQQAQIDDSPLYVFDSSFPKYAPTLAKDYEIPFLFPEDLFELVGDSRRPPHQWFLIGPERSGTELHIDPLGTSAWNTLIRGRKLWVMFAPPFNRLIAKGKKYKTVDDEAIDYFSLFLPQILKNDMSSKQIREEFLIFIQQPGETIFVPAGWLHAVLNLDDTVAVTQNYVGSVNFAHSWTITRKERKKMARKLLRKLLENGRQDLVEIANAIDRADGYDLEEAIRTKKKDKKQKTY